MKRVSLKLKTFLAAVFSISAAMLFIPGSSAYAHDPIFIGEEQKEAEEGPYLPDARISFALYGTFLESDERRGFQFEIPDGETITMSLLIPDLSPEKEIETPYLPWLTLERPDGTQIDLLPDIRVAFAEPFSRTNYLRLFDHSEIGREGTYQVTIYGLDPSRFTVSIGFIEMFGTEVLNVENRNDRGALERWYATPPPEFMQSETTTTEQAVDVDLPKEALLEPDNEPIKEENVKTGLVQPADESVSDEGFPVQLLFGGLIASVLLALLPLLKYRKRV
ncbi:MAG: hypothetical protein P8K64_04205 [Acidimicrobiales bacterium]|nr:hypothetical protein [Acidimicrobiales bacterium]